MVSWKKSLVLVFLNFEIVLGIFKANRTCPKADKSSEKLAEKFWTKNPVNNYYKPVAYVPISNNDSLITILDFLVDTISSNCLRLMVNTEDEVMKLFCKSDYMTFPYKSIGRYLFS